MTDLCIEAAAVARVPCRSTPSGRTWTVRRRRRTPERAKFLRPAGIDGGLGPGGRLAPGPRPARRPSTTGPRAHLELTIAKLRRQLFGVSRGAHGRFLDEFAFASGGAEGQLQLALRQDGRPRKSSLSSVVDCPAAPAKPREPPTATSITPKLDTCAIASSWPRELNAQR
jgi:hypothetical protein